MHTCYTHIHKHTLRRIFALFQHVCSVAMLNVVQYSLVLLYHHTKYQCICFSLYVLARSFCIRNFVYVYETIFYDSFDSCTRMIYNWFIFSHVAYCIDWLTKGGIFISGKNVYVYLCVSWLVQQYTGFHLEINRVDIFAIYIIKIVFVIAWERILWVNGCCVIIRNKFIIYKLL